MAPKSAPGPAQSLDFILDIPLRVAVELGRTKMTIRDILQLTQGSVVELSKFAGEPLEILVNDKLESAEKWARDIDEEPEKSTAASLVQGYKGGNFF